MISKIILNTSPTLYLALGAWNRPQKSADTIDKHSPKETEAGILVPR